MAKLVLRRGTRDRHKIYLQVRTNGPPETEYSDIAVITDAKAAELEYFGFASWVHPEDKKIPKQKIHCPNCQHEVGEES